jgi:hypothetical protein
MLTKQKQREVLEIYNEETFYDTLKKYIKKEYLKEYQKTYGKFK